MRVKTWLAITTLIITLPIAVVLVGASVNKMPSEFTTPAGFKRSDSFYLTMRDDVKIAVEVWLPPTLRPQEKVPTLIRSTRYWRHFQYGFLERIMYFLALSENDGIDPWGTRTFNDENFSVVLVDMRGSGASFGNRSIFWHPDEAEDLGEVTDWIVRQPWSNGRVGAFGISYEGNTSMMLAASGRDSVAAIAPLFDVYDLRGGLFAPGGVTNNSFVQAWSEVTQLMDENDLCDVIEARFGRALKLHEHFIAKLSTSGVKPAGQQGHKDLKTILKTRNNTNVADAVKSIEYRGNLFGQSGLSMEDVTGTAYANQVQEANAALFSWASWTDAAFVDGTIARFESLSNPQLLFIGSYTHGGFQDTDPFAVIDTTAESDVPLQYQLGAKYLGEHLSDKGKREPIREIHYFTMGARRWNKTSTWPPAGVKMRRMYFSGNNALPDTKPTDVMTWDDYKVDYSASSGASNTRCHTSFGGADVIYNDRAEADKGLITYTSTPLQNDTEITGNVVLNLMLSSTHEDGAIHAYLEDVAPDGSVSYLTEGVLRFIHRKTVGPENCPVVKLNPCHSLREIDAEPMTPGAATPVSLTLYATSVLMEKGHRLRIAIAGAASPVFQRYPADGNATWKIYRDDINASFIDVPIQYNAHQNSTQRVQ